MLIIAVKSVWRLRSRSRTAIFLYRNGRCCRRNSNCQISCPMATNNLHCEVELVVALKSGATSISVEQAMDHIPWIWRYVILQNFAKEHQEPWHASKVFNHLAPIASITPSLEGTDSSSSSSPSPSSSSSSIDSKAAHISLQVNWQTRQSGPIDQIIWFGPTLKLYPPYLTDWSMHGEIWFRCRPTCSWRPCQRTDGRFGKYRHYHYVIHLNRIPVLYLRAFCSTGFYRWTMADFYVSSELEWISSLPHLSLSSSKSW